jgi:hypothetical protein
VGRYGTDFRGLKPGCPRGRQGSNPCFGTTIEGKELDGLLRAVDALVINVPDLDAALEFYRDALGHHVVWRGDRAAGLRMPGAETELVLSLDLAPETDVRVASVPDAVRAFVAAGGDVVSEPAEIPVGRVAVVRDPFGTRLTLVDLSKGRYRTDADGWITGVGEERRPGEGGRDDRIRTGE